MKTVNESVHCQNLNACLSGSRKWPANVGTNSKSSLNVLVDHNQANAMYFL
jgi:hypothetical protein